MTTCRRWSCEGARPDDEINPWSNYATNSVRRIGHQVKRLFDLGVTINSDDPEVLDTNLNHEYRIAHEILGMSMDDIAAANCRRRSFCPKPKSKKFRINIFHLIFKCSRPTTPGRAYIRVGRGGPEAR
jgi:hypothetical protein